MKRKLPLLLSVFGCAVAFGAGAEGTAGRLGEYGDVAPLGRAGKGEVGMTVGALRGPQGGAHRDGADGRPAVRHHDVADVALLGHRLDAARHSGGPGRQRLVGAGLHACRPS